MKPSNSSLISSLRVVHMPCGAPLMILSLASLTSLEDSMAEAAMGTIWSSSPCRISVGTSNFFRSSVVSVSENALMQKYEPGKAHIMRCHQKEEIKPCERFAPARLYP